MIDAIEHDLPHAKRKLFIPFAGKLLCLTRGGETELDYFDMAYWKKA